MPVVLPAVLVPVLLRLGAGRDYALFLIYTTVLVLASEYMCPCRRDGGGEREMDVESRNPNWKMKKLEANFICETKPI